MVSVYCTSSVCITCGAALPEARIGQGARGASPCCSKECRLAWKKVRQAKVYAAKRAADPEALREYQRAWCAANPERVHKYRQTFIAAHDTKDYQRLYYLAHRERILEEQQRRIASGVTREAWKQRMTVSENLEKERARNRARMKQKRANNPAFKQMERIRAKAWYWQHRNDPKTPEQVSKLRARARAYIKTPKGRAALRVSCENHRARKRRVFVESVDPSVVFSRANGICGICRKAIDFSGNWHVDHVVPLARGGVHSYDNVQPAHAWCNVSKGAKIPKGQLGLFQKVVA